MEGSKSMTRDQQIILTCFEINLSQAKTLAMRKHVQEQIASFKLQCNPKPKPRYPAWVDKF